jgi:hypothetical protein
MTSLPTPRWPSSGPTAYERTASGSTILALAARPGYPKVEDPDVLAYLKRENAYFEAAMAPHRPLIDTLFEEMKGGSRRMTARSGQGRRLALLVGVRGRRAISHWYRGPPAAAPSS